MNSRYDYSRDTELLEKKFSAQDLRGARQSTRIVFGVLTDGDLSDFKDEKRRETIMNRSVQALSVIATALMATFTPCSLAQEEQIWHIKAIHPEGRLLDVKALDKNGKTYDVKAIEVDGNRHVIDIKALMGDEKLPIKILVSEDRVAPVKALGDDGTIYDIKALTAEGRKLDVKGVTRSGNIFHIKAIAPDGKHFGVKAISPDGFVHDVKGVKMTAEKVEATINGVAVAAHVKALPQVR